MSIWTTGYHFQNPDKHGPPTRERWAVKAAVELYPNRAFHGVAAAIAQQSPRAVEYLQQAPVFCLAILHGRRVAEKYMTFGAFQFAKAAEAGESLRKLLRMFDLPMQYRVLKGSSMSLGVWEVLHQMRRLNPSTLAQSIPQDKGQRNWLHGLRDWQAQSRRNFGDTLHLDWAVRNMTRSHAMNERIVNQAVDYIGHLVRHPAGDHFDPRTPLESVLVNAERWHERMAREAGRAAWKAQQWGYEEEINYAPFPLAWEIDRYRFVALNTPALINIEAAAMVNCARSYIHHVINGRSRLYTVTLDGMRVAMVEYRYDSGRITMPQCEGPKGARVVGHQTRMAAGSFLAHVNDLMKKENRK